MLDRVPKPIREQISAALGCNLKTFDFASGGCINHGGELKTENDSYFLKWNVAKKFPDMFAAEDKGLQLLSETSAIRVPKVVLTNVVENFQFLLLEYIGQGNPSEKFWQKFGAQLAQLHKNTSTHFGLHFNNYIGSLPQQNAKHAGWIAFFIHERLMPQVALCQRDNKLPGSGAQCL